MAGKSPRSLAGKSSGLFPGRMLSPEIAALSMSGSSVIVAVNALLLKRLRLPAQAPAATTMQKEPEHA